MTYVILSLLSGIVIYIICNFWMVCALIVLWALRTEGWPWPNKAIAKIVILMICIGYFGRGLPEWFVYDPKDNLYPLESYIGPYFPWEDPSPGHRALKAALEAWPIEPVKRSEVR